MGTQLEEFRKIVETCLLLPKSLLIISFSLHSIYQVNKCHLEYKCFSIKEGSERKRRLP
jgi:hypothetical protein